MTKEEYREESLFYQEIASQYKAALKLCLARQCEIPWSEIRDEDIQSYVKAAIELGVK